MKTIPNNALNGSKGGKVRSRVKSLAARQNALLRWHGKSQDGVIPIEALIDGAWYLGKGRTAPIAVWDAHARAFHTVGINSYTEPENYPKISRRVVRLKQESHIMIPGGSFAPVQIAAGSLPDETI